MNERSQHDEFLKAILEQPGTAGALLRERLPPEVVALLAPGEPELVQASFVDPELRQSHSDRLFRLARSDGGSLFVYCLVEHKSEPDPRVAWQLLRYLVRVWARLDRDSDGRGKLPPIVPLVVYHGAQDWDAPRRFAAMVEAPPELLPHLLDFPFGFVDIPHIPDAQLSTSLVLQVGLLILKYAFVVTDEPPVEWVADQLSRLRHAGVPREFLEQALRYIWGAYETMDREAVVAAANRAAPGQEDDMVSPFARELLAEGRAEGEAKGRAEGRAEGEARGVAGSLLRVLERRFGRVPAKYRLAIQNGQIDQLQAWLDRAIDAPSLKAVFALRVH